MFAWTARSAICELSRRRTAIAIAPLCGVLQALHNDAVAIAVRRRSGLQFARLARTMRTPKTGIRM
eukprot:10729528-Lingulodinium_polyedra.AAC.1